MKDRTKWECPNREPDAPAENTRRRGMESWFGEKHVRSGLRSARSSRGLVPCLIGSAVYGPVRTVVWDRGANHSRGPDSPFLAFMRRIRPTTYNMASNAKVALNIGRSIAYDIIAELPNKRIPEGNAQREVGLDSESSFSPLFQRNIRIGITMLPPIKRPTPIDVSRLVSSEAINLDFLATSSPPTPERQG